MLKPLLRTLPTLSGNVKLACTLKDYEKLSNEEYSSYVRFARLLPLSSNLSQKNIEVNLLYSSYDFDLARFYSQYSNYFYEYVFDYDKYNYIELDKYDCQNNRNTDFEFGCKRISYKKNGDQFAFYAPLYIESFEDIPDFFNIYIVLKNQKYRIERTIKVNISASNTRNYLKTYLNNYLSKIDSNVIFCNPKSNQATYYGIDLVHGGLKKTVDNIIAKNFNKQNTINNFDAIITNGFKRNQLAIRQIIPLCFCFSINDILNDEEKKNFKNSEAYISGSWFKDGKELKFYDIDTNYQYFYQNPYFINRDTGIFTYINSMNNIMNMNYPSLNESMNYGYRYSNKLELKYNRWKLKYSDDEHPYISNLSPAFSINQNSLYRYGQFPEKYKPIRLFVEDSNFFIPVGHTITNERSPYYSDKSIVSNYYKLLNNNISTWYSLVDSTDGIFEKDIWEDTSDNRVYFNGILYDFNKIYESYPDLLDIIDKFSVIVDVNFNPVPKDELYKIKRVKNAFLNSDKYVVEKNARINESISYSLEDDRFNNMSNFYDVASSLSRYNVEIRKNALFIEDPEGDFINPEEYGFSPENINIYYKYSDIIQRYPELENVFDRYQGYLINGYQLIRATRLGNLMHENERDIVFENKDADWLLENLYFSQNGNKFKSLYDRYTIASLMTTYPDKKNMISFYYKTQFISKYNLKDLLSKEGYSVLLANALESYLYEPILKDEDGVEYASDTFIYNYKDNDYIYVDLYNLNNVIADYNSKNTGNTVPLVDSLVKENFYAKFLNLKHLLYYVSDLYKDENKKEDIIKLYKSLYIKQRIILGDASHTDVEIKDQYIPIKRLYDDFRELTVEEKIAILTATDTDSSAAKDVKSESYYEFKGRNPEAVPIFYTVTDGESASKIHGIPDGGKMELTFEEMMNYCKEHASENANPNYRTAESFENINVDAGYYTSSNIFEKDNSQSNYNTSTYRLKQYGDSYKMDHIVFWHCDQYNVYHDVYYNMERQSAYRTVTHSENTGEYLIYDYTWYKSSSMYDYHADVFYYIPDLYMRLETKISSTKSTYEYVPVVDFVKRYVNEFNPNLVKYVNENTISLLEKYDVDELDFDDTLTDSMLIFENRTNKETIKTALYDDFAELKSYIKKIDIANNVYYKIPVTYSNPAVRSTIKYVDTFKKLDNYTGLLDYVIFDDLDLKVAHIYGDLNIITYVIDENGEFVYKDYNTPIYIKRTEKDSDYVDYVKKQIADFCNDVEYHEDNNYFTFSKAYLYRHNIDDLMNIPDYDNEFTSKFSFEIVYNKDFVKIDKNIFDMINLEDDSKPYKDLYLYTQYKDDSYPATLRIKYYEQSPVDIITNTDACLTPLFNDIFLQDKKYTVIYSEYCKTNVFKSEDNYKYALNNIEYLYDISSKPYNTEYFIDGKKYYTYSYYNELVNDGNEAALSGHSYFKGYRMLNSSYCINSKSYDDLGIYDKYKINTYIYSYNYTYTYSYTHPEIVVNGSYSVLDMVEKTGIGRGIGYMTYGFILLDAYTDNTSASFNIIDKNYKEVKYFTYVNEENIYENDIVMNSFNLMMPALKANLLENLSAIDNEILLRPKLYKINTYYKQIPINDLNGQPYAYEIKKRDSAIDTLVLQRYFNSIVPYIKETNVLESTYNLKYKNFKYPNTDVDYMKDIFYPENINIYNYNKLRVYDISNSYTLYEPLEYKHLNDNKHINLKEEFEIKESGTFTYDEILSKERDEYVFKKFKEYVLSDKLNVYEDNEILFLFNRYDIEYDVESVGLNYSRTEKKYKLSYKFKLF